MLSEPLIGELGTTIFFDTNAPHFDYKNSKTTFKNLNIKFEENILVGIKSDNGTGKSTLVDLIVGFLKPTNGSIEFNKQSFYNK